MKRWQAPRDFRIIVYLLGAAGLGGVAVGSGNELVRALRGSLDTWPISIVLYGFALATLVGLIAAIGLIWGAIQHASLAYRLDRNAIYVVRWGNRYIIPLDKVVGVMPHGSTHVSVAKPRQRFGRGRSQQQLIVETSDRSYTLALVERDAFLREVRERQLLGVVQPQREGLARAWPAFSNFLGTPTVRRLLLGIVLLNLALWALLSWQYPLLPETVPVRFDPLGGTAGTRARSYTLLLPAVATAMALINGIFALGIFRRSRLAGELLLLGVLTVQLLAMIAIWFIVTGVQESVVMTVVGRA